MGRCLPRRGHIHENAEASAAQDQAGIWGAVVGAAALAVVGFGQLGWRTPGSTRQSAQEQADAAVVTALVVTALVPVCVTKAQQDTDTTKLVKLRKEESSYTRRSMVSDNGWATVLGAAVPNPALADACSQILAPEKAA